MLDPQKRPNLFILGAPKCGTTSLSAWLSQHPEIHFSPEKEPHHFYSPYGQSMDRDAYEALFRDAAPSMKYRAEASVWYLFGGTAVPKILEYSPDARFIVCLRNPVEMAPSLHAQTLYIGRELIRDFAKAWELSDRRYAGEQAGVFGFRQGNPACMAYRQACLLGEQVERLLSQVDKNRLLFLLLDEIATDPDAVWRRVLDFLGLEHSPNISFEKVNSAKRRKYMFLQRFTLAVQNLKKKAGFRKRFGVLAFFNRKNIVAEKYAEPSGEQKRAMQEAFENDILKLSSYINKDLSAWLKKPSESQKI